GEGDLRQIAAVDEAAESQHAVSHLSGARENGGAAGEMCGVRDADSRRGSGLRRVRGACRRAAVTSGGRAFRFPRRGSVRASEVSTTRLRPGYDMEEVDAFLDAVRDTFLGVRQPPLTAEEIRAKQFATTRLRPGYDEEEVDAFLQDVEARLRARCAECGAETGGAVQVCAACGAPAVARPPVAVGPTPETCLTCGAGTAGHPPRCPAPATGERAPPGPGGPRRSGAAGHGRPARGGGQAGPLARAVGGRAGLGHGGLRGHPGHRREVVRGTRARPVAAEMAARGDARVAGVRVRAAHHAVRWRWRWRRRGMTSSRSPGLGPEVDPGRPLQPSQRSRGIPHRPGSLTARIVPRPPACAETTATG